MVKDIMKMAGVKSKKEFYDKYPTEESFLEAFPQAVKMFPQMAKGGATDGVAFPQAPVAGTFFNYGPPTMNIPRLFQDGGDMQQQVDIGQLVEMVAQQLGISPEDIMGLLQQDPQMMAQLEQVAAQDPQQAAQAIAQMVQEAMGGQVPQEEAEMMAAQQAMPEEGMVPPMMAYGGNPFMESPLDKFVNGGSPLPMYQTATAQCPEGYKPDPSKKPTDPGYCIPMTRFENIQESLSGSNLGTLASLYLGSRVGIPAVQRVMKALGPGTTAAGKAFAKDWPKTAAFLNIGQKTGKNVKLTTGEKIAREARGLVAPGAYLGYGYLTSAPAGQVAVPALNVPGVQAAPASSTAVRTNNPPADTTSVPVLKRGYKTVEIKEYGGGISVNPFDYGVYAPPMAYGGTNALMGETDYAPVSSERIGNLMKFIRGGMEKTQMEEMMGINPQDVARYGKSVKKKKG
jgi:hypothetical protein